MNSTNFINFTNLNCPDVANQVYFYLVTFASCSLNLILLFLARSNTHDIMKPYLKVLYTSIVLDLFSGLTLGLTQTRPLLLGDFETMTIAADGFLPRALQDWSIFSGGNLNYLFIPDYFACYSVFSFGTVSFLFRYLMICWDYEMSKVVFGVVSVFVLSIALIIAVCLGHLSAVVYRDSLLLIPEGDPDCLRLLPLISNYGSIMTPQINLIFKIWAYAQVFLYLSYIVNLYFSFRIFAHLRKQSVLISAVNNRIERQITLTFVIQGLVPLIIYYWPFVTLVLARLFPVLKDVMFSRATLLKLMFKAYAMISLTNPLIAILLIGTYREAFFNYFTRTWRKVLGIQISTVQTSDNMMVS